MRTHLRIRNAATALGTAADFLRREARQVTRSESGASMAEYALIIAVIALVAVAGAKTLGSTLNDRTAAAAAVISNP